MLLINNSRALGKIAECSALLPCFEESTDVYVYGYTVFPIKDGNIVLPHPLILKFMLKNTVL